MLQKYQSKNLLIENTQEEYYSHKIIATILIVAAGKNSITLFHFILNVTILHAYFDAQKKISVQFLNDQYKINK